MATLLLASCSPAVEEEEEVTVVEEKEVAVVEEEEEATQPAEAPMRTADVWLDLLRLIPIESDTLQFGVVIAEYPSPVSAFLQIRKQE